MSEQNANGAKNTPTDSSAVTDLPTPGVKQAMAVSPAPDSSLQPAIATTTKPAAVSSGENTAVTGHSDNFYVIKPGDTLTHIAKAHGTTVKALKAANSLANDRIVVGARLKIPEA
jgi:LysM repeat protein